jgi:cell division septal protein FtsQ
MATQRRTKTQTKVKPEQPAELRWQQPPPKPRKQMRRVQTTAVRATPQTPRARPATTSTPLRVRLGGSWQTYLRIGLIVLVVAGCAIGFWELLRLPQLTVTANTTLVGGSQRISTQDIFAASQVENRNILLVRPADVKGRVAAVPGIAHADVHARLPNQVLIDVQEHLPLVTWRGITTTLWLSADGAEVPQAGEPPPLTLNDLSGIPLAESLPTWQAVLPQLAAIRQDRPDLAELSYGKLEGLYLRSSKGWTVWLGNEEIAAKLTMLDAVENEIAARGERPTVIDMRYSARQAFWR